MLIFLDIDGVMVPATGWKVPENLEDGFPVFSKKSTSALRDLMADHAHTKIILSTSHRDRFTIEQWKAIFKKRGIDVTNMDRLASNQNLTKKRREEIEEWFREHIVTDDFIIIDDDSTLHALPVELKHNLVITRPSIGLTPEDIVAIA